MFLDGVLQMQLVNRLMDTYGYNDEKIRKYQFYVAHCIVDYDTWDDYNDMLDFLTKNYGRLEIA